MADLEGRVVAFLEARRRDELASLIARHNGVPYPAPCLREVHWPEAVEVQEAVSRICADDLDACLFLTAAGASTIFESARRLGRDGELLEGLARKGVAARGPKPANLLRRMGVRVDVLAPQPHTSEHLLDAVADCWQLDSMRVLLQHAGVPNPWLRSELIDRGATVVDVTTYECVRPADSVAVVGLIEALLHDRVDVLAVTCAPQVDNLLEIAADHGLAAEVRAALKRVPIAAQGDVCVSAVSAQGLPVSIVPSHPTMGALVLAIADHFAGTPTGLSTRGAALRAAVIAVVGSRSYPELDRVREFVGALPQGTTVVTGGTRGVDRVVERTAIEHGLAVRVVQARESGQSRAEQIVRDVDRLVAFWDGQSPGTRRLISLAERYAKAVDVVRPSRILKA